MSRQGIFLGDTPLRIPDERPQGEFIDENGMTLYRIRDYDRMPPFFMTLTNPADLWLFLSSTGGLTAGRTSPDHAVFPYGTVDRITESYVSTGPRTIVLVEDEERIHLWEPLRPSGISVYDRTRALSKTVPGDVVVFEESNRDLELTFRSGWDTSPRYGIHRFASLRNDGARSVRLRIWDGLRNILPAGATAQVQSSYSNLLDAYKRTQVDPLTGLGVFAMSAALTDKAEPSESLRATTVWSYGIDDGIVLLSDRQESRFRSGSHPVAETDVKGERGAYVRAGSFSIPPGKIREWGYCADVEQDHVAVTALQKSLREDKASLVADLHRDRKAARIRLRGIAEANDGRQETGSPESHHHHVVNVIFNVMRGGYFVWGYAIDPRDFSRFIASWNRDVAEEHASWLASLPDDLTLPELIRLAGETGDEDLRRTAREYLPLTFSRRHGDPSRPWNRFSIATEDRDGRPVVGYQGNWRDIFQNWEALCLSYPAYFPSTVAKFLNATTADGYNPYRISQDGIDWEVPEPDNPWSNIGYWSDHQIIYLTKLLEHALHHGPDDVRALLDDRFFVYADVPYRIKPLDHLLADPYDSIVFDQERDRLLRTRAAKLGADGRLLADGTGKLARGTMAEKLTILLLAKTANYVPGGGIWMNTQRPEWNDANNALAGWGLSMVTLAYLLRFLDLFEELLAEDDAEGYRFHPEVIRWFDGTISALSKTAATDANEPTARLALLRELGGVAEAYRVAVYRDGLSDDTRVVGRSVLLEGISLCRRHFRETLASARSKDGTFESYQVLRIVDERAEVRTLYPMLEGQVAGISSGLVEPSETVRILDALKSGPLYREDQHSYMLYPNREIPGFLEKNALPDGASDRLRVLNRPASEWRHILRKDADDIWRFDGSFHNVRDLESAASSLSPEEREELVDVYEETFLHEAFTGRSGTFFAYEGLGSIYWHMVSKLLLAVQERLVEAVLQDADPEVIRDLKERYQDVRSGIGFHKDPETYGAFPPDPYSHTPWGRGAKQPGMTGQVKEEVIARYAELGLVVRDGAVRFLPELILDDQWRRGTDDFIFTYCGVPVRVVRAGESGIVVTPSDGEAIRFDDLAISREISSEIFSRSEKVSSVEVRISGS